MVFLPQRTGTRYRGGVHLLNPGEPCGNLTAAEDYADTTPCGDCGHIAGAFLLDVPTNAIDDDILGFTFPPGPQILERVPTARATFGPGGVRTFFPRDSAEFYCRFTGPANVSAVQWHLAYGTWGRQAVGFPPFPGFSAFVGWGLIADLFFEQWVWRFGGPVIDGVHLSTFDPALFDGLGTNRFRPHQLGTGATLNDEFQETSPDLDITPYYG